MTNASARSLSISQPLDLSATLAPYRRGPGDPTMRISRDAVARAFRVRSGPVSVLLRRQGARLTGEAWGPGALEILDRLASLVGLDDDPTGFEPRLHPLIAELARRRPGIRLPRTGAVLDVLVPAILEQKVTGTEAFRAFRRLVLVHGEPAPGPLGLRLAPSPATLAGLPSWSFPPLGIEPRRGALLRRVASEADRLEALAEGCLAPARGGAGAEELTARLTAFRGIGPWTAAEVTLRALGDADAVSLGDFHLPNLVAWALAGEPRGTDARMVELLEPWRGHRARVVRLLETSGIAAPRYGPRMAPRDIQGL
jgi:3-methyladenine DNA glycosylase/8-oxoguanine DNA glycosylase